MMPSVLLLSRYNRMGPSSRVRHFNFLAELEDAGFQVTTAPFLPDAYLEGSFRGDRPSLAVLISAYLRRLGQLLRVQQYDLIWIEKEALPWFPAAIERLFLGSRPFVVDFDDPWYLRYSKHRLGLVRRLMGGKLERLAARATVVTAGSSNLTGWLRSAGCERVVEIPSVVDIDRYPLRPLPDGPFTIGWIGTPGNERYLDLIAHPLRVLCERFGARVRMIGGGRGYSLPGVTIDYVPWREETEAEELARFHVGVMPLSDGLWERGKCGYKLIQYMAAGRAAVVSPVGPARSILLPRQTGFFAATDEDWIEALSDLANDRELALTIGATARRRAIAVYSLKVNAPVLFAVLRQALADEIVAEERRRDKTAT